VDRALTALLLSWCASTAWAVEADPQSQACQRALASLQAREAELAAAARADTPPRPLADARWQALRADAARACLGREGAASAPLPRLSLPPPSVPPVVVPASPSESAQRRPPSPLAPPVPTYRPPEGVMSCDPLGCWTSGGARLPHAGRDPLDARVRCTVQGQIVVCL
jgi:hypothetical protein